MPRYELEATANPEYGAPSPSPAKFGWATASDLWSLAGLLGAGGGAAGLAALLLLAVVFHLAWWTVPVAALVGAGAGFCGGAIYLAYDRHKLQWAAMPKPKEQATTSTKLEPWLVYVNNATATAGKTTDIAALSQPAPVEDTSNPLLQAQILKAMRFRYFIEHIYA